jgi:hypothetical protein
MSLNDYDMNINVFLTVSVHSLNQYPYPQLCNFL